MSPDDAPQGATAPRRLSVYAWRYGVALVGICATAWGLRHLSTDPFMIAVTRGRSQAEFILGLANDREATATLVRDWEDRESSQLYDEIYVWCRPIPPPGKFLASMNGDALVPATRIGPDGDREVLLLRRLQVYSGRWESLSLTLSVHDAPGWADEQARVAIVERNMYDVVFINVLRTPLGLVSIAFGSLLTAWNLSAPRPPGRYRTAAPVSLAIIAGLSVGLATLTSHATAACLIVPWLVFDRVRNPPSARSAGR